MVVDGAVVMVENIVRHSEPPERIPTDPDGQDSRGRPRGAAAGVLCHRHHHYGLSAHLHAAGVEGRLFKPMAWTVAFALLGALTFSMIVAPVLASFFFPRGAKEWHNPVMEFWSERYRKRVTWAIRIAAVTVGLAWPDC